MQQKKIIKEKFKQKKKNCQIRSRSKRWGVVQVARVLMINWQKKSTKTSEKVCKLNYKWLQKSYLLFYNILSDCHYVDEINYLLNAYRWQKKKRIWIPKVNSVQEACIKCLSVHTLKFEILKPTWKTKQKSLEALVFMF